MKALKSRSPSEIPGCEQTRSQLQGVTYPRGVNNTTFLAFQIRCVRFSHPLHHPVCVYSCGRFRLREQDASFRYSITGLVEREGEEVHTMFRMEFQTLDAVEEDDGLLRGRGKTVWEENYRHRVSPPKTFEGHVGGAARTHRTVSSNGAIRNGSHLSQVLTRSVSSGAAVPPQRWMEVDLIDFESEPAAVDEEVLRELVKPFAESVNLTHQPSGKRIDSDVFVTFLEYQPQQQKRDLLSDHGSFRNLASLQTRSSSMRSNGSTSWSDSSDAEGSPFCADRVHIKNEEKGSPAARAYNRAFNKLMHKKSKPTVSDAKITKPWEEPLLASHDQMKWQRKLEKEAKLEAKREAEEAKKEAESRKRELLKLANPLPESMMKEQKRKGIHKLFQLSSGSPREGAGDARESKLVMPRASMFESCVSPSGTEVALAHIRSGPRPSMRKDIHFATVESNQRNVEAWTMEEYMAKNARLPEWTARENDEEFGGIEGNQLLNQYFDEDVTDHVDSDSD